MKFAFLLFIVLVFNQNSTIGLFGENSSELISPSKSGSSNTIVESPLVIPEEAEKSITGWKEFQLGSDYKDVAEILSEKYLWLVPEKSLFPEIDEDANTPSISIAPNDFINKLYFQFNSEKKLYLIRLVLSKNYFGYLKLYDQLKKKYGPAQEVKYKKAIWKNADNKVILERNNTIKYFSKSGFPSTNRINMDPIGNTETSIVSNILLGL